MSGRRCPDGHLSQADDWCDVCGQAMPAPDAAPAPAADATPPAPAGPVCEQCGAARGSGAMFCEACGHRLGEPATPAAPAAPFEPTEPTTAPAVPNGSASAPVAWVAEVWIDPDWYAGQDSDEACPSVGAPVVVPLRASSVLVGRRSVSRNITPEVDCGVDTGVSRRHAQLTNDGSRWFVEDLQSANGTFVGSSGGELPTEPVPPGQRRELDDDERLYLGAWTRVVVRPATADEQDD